MLGRLIQRSSPAPFVQGQAYGALDWGTGFWPGVPTTSLGLTNFAGVGESSTLALSAAWRCLHILTDGIGALDLTSIDVSQGDRWAEAPKVLADPWPQVTPVEWRSMVVASLVMHGNAYLLPTDLDPRTGYPRQVPLVHPTRMRVEMVNGRPRYWLDDNRVHELDVLHIRGLQAPGAAVGVGIVEAQRLGIAMAGAMDRYQFGNLEQSSVPPVTIKVNRPEISKEQAEDIQLRWMQRHSAGSRIPAVLPSSLEIQPLAWSPEDSQFLESKRHMAVEICWWFGIDPRLLSLSAGGSSVTYANIESAYADLVKMSFTPWTSRIESAMSRLLPRNQLARFDFSSLLRPTIGDRYKNYETALRAGFITVDEVRNLEGLGPVDENPEPITPPKVMPLKLANQRLPIDPTEEMVW